MSSTSISSLPAEVPESVSKAVVAFRLGDLSLLDVRQIIAQALESDTTLAEPIHELLDDHLKARTLTIADYGELVGTIGAVASENVPTDCAENAPNVSGVYRVVEEGTLVPTELVDEPEAESYTRPYDRPATGKASHANKMPAVGTVLRDRFRLEEELARGAMGVVFRATDLMKQNAGADDPHIAIKLVSPDIAGDKNALKSFQNEFVNTQHLSHPNIIRFFELDRHDDHYFITMEWLEGQSLASLLDSNEGSGLSHARIYAIIEQLCDALIYAHEHNVVHADVKPGNVFLCTTGEVKLIDFGIARNESDLADHIDADGNEAVALTPAYASCERLEKQVPSTRDDLYSLASLIYRLIAGRRVFGSLTALEAEAQSAEPVRISRLDDRRWNALAKALSFRRAGRQSGVQVFADEFGRRRTPRAGMEIDFPLDDDTAQAAEPEMPGAFDTTALSSDSEKIVQTFEFESESESKVVPQPVALSLKQRSGAHLARIRTLVDSWLGHFTGLQKLIAGLLVILLLMAAVGISRFSSDDTAVPAVTVRMPARAAPDVTPQASLLVEAAPVVSVLTAVDARPEQEPKPEPEPEPESAPEPKPAAEPKPRPEPASEPGPNPEPGPESGSNPEQEPVIAALPYEPGQAPVTPVESEALSLATYVPAAVAEPEAVTALIGPEERLALPQELRRDLATVPVPVPVPEPAPDSVALSQLSFVEYVEPRYPRGSNDRRYEGWVDLEFRIGTDGLPVDIEVVGTNLPNKFKTTSVTAVEKWQFQPYLHLGEPIVVNSAVRLRYAN